MNKPTKAGEAFESRLVSATAEAALGAIGEAGQRAESLVAAWVDAKNIEAVAELAEHGAGPARKAARRALNVLGARGVAIPSRGRVAAVAAPAAPDVVEGWMMAPDSSGMQLFAIASRSPSGRGRAAFVFLHGAQGVARVDNAAMSQSQLKNYFAKVLPGSGYGATRVPVEWVRYRIADARRVHRERSLPEPLGFTTAAPLLSPVPETPPPHPFDEEGLELSADDAAELAKSSASLHNLPEFRSWLPTNATLEEMLVNVGTKLGAGESRDPAAVAEQLRQEVEAATDRFFTPEVRKEVIRRMKDSALSVLGREGEQKALEISAAIAVVDNAGLITNPPRDVPFLKAFFDKAVAMMIAQGGGRLRIPVPAGLEPVEAPSAENAAAEEPAVEAPAAAHADD